MDGWTDGLTQLSAYTDLLREVCAIPAPPPCPFPQPPTPFLPQADGQMDRACVFKGCRTGVDLGNEQLVFASWEPSATENNRAELSQKLGEIGVLTYFSNEESRAEDVAAK